MQICLLSSTHFELVLNCLFLFNNFDSSKILQETSIIILFDLFYFLASMQMLHYKQRGGACVVLTVVFKVGEKIRNNCMV